MVEAIRITGETNVDELVTRLPGTARAFLRRRMGCVGCPLARFETVAEVCDVYRQPLDAMLADLRRAGAPGAAPAEWQRDRWSGARRRRA